MEDWLLLENGTLLYIPAVTTVEFSKEGQHTGKAIAFGFGVLLSGESKMIGDYFGKIRDEILAAREKASNLDAEK